MRARTLAASIAAHTIAAGVLVWLAPAHVAPRVASATIELVDAVVTTKNNEPSARTHDADRHAVAANSAARARVARTRSQPVEDPRGEIRLEGGADNHVGDGDGGGTGRGAGDGGFGLGDGARVAATADTALAPPPPPPASKARPARLVYPVRERDADGTELFIARVTIDDEGFVVGAQLVQGFGGPRDAMAADLIWKFRYAPALDDDGRPVRSTLDQRFLVGR